MCRDAKFAPGCAVLSVARVRSDHRRLNDVQSTDQRGVRALRVSLLGLTATFHPFIGFPSYRAISHLPLAERVSAMRNPEVRSKMLSEKSEKIGDRFALVARVSSSLSCLGPG